MYKVLYTCDRVTSDLEYMAQVLCHATSFIIRQQPLTPGIGQEHGHRWGRERRRS